MAQEMNHPSVNIIEQSQVAPPQGSFPSTTLPLSFLDIPFFLTRHVRRIFFYEFPFPTHHFLQTALPNLKTLSFPHPTSNTSSLSPPISSSLHIPTSLTSVTLTATLSHSLLQSLLTQTSPSSPQDVNDWQPLVPVLPSPRTTHDGTSITNSGFSIDNHVAGDGRTIHHFMKFWVSVCKAEGGFSGSVPLPFHDRDIVKDPKGLMRIYLQEIRNSALQSKQFGGFLPSVYTDKVRATFIFSSEQAEKLKKWVSLKCNGHGSGMLHISTFVGTCSLIWVCMIKSEHKEKDLLRLTSDEPCNFGFSAVCHNHPQLLLPSNYFGNCLVPLITAVKRGELEGQNGIVAAANAIGRVIRGFKSDA
ncbi:Coumaroyl-CoA:anthocyanidin 3-O-glucoside-6''-O-coumaroyltransferase 2 [Spatholobus suberectus]|nr:Coumaroyl-CoA:anthocyanidin 3-O-glucoside-6''-O-coumaroyltransferase 2 [Spatholobus suberectus]